MDEHISHFTLLVNRFLGPLALQLLHALRIQPESYDAPIPEYVVMSFLVLVVGAVLALLLRSRLSVDRPGTFQQMAEGLLTNRLGFGIRDVLRVNAGHHADSCIAFTGSISIFVLLANLLGLIPALSSPTGVAVVPLACAILTFLYFNYQGLRNHGPIGYAKHFAGPIWWLSWLIFPVELISTSARLLSLTVRLWANIFASDLIYVIFLGLLLQPFTWAAEKSFLLAIPFGILAALIPLLFVALHIFVSIIQSYVFTVLPSIYIGMATADEH
ncbi:MAG TPA: F0F1 ATP synthase subunit A [Candidatus Acidoferrum sp.]|nr:F0F1 ATP synthase subunit A [Candidatus Acidoferrum sp.]